MQQFSNHLCLFSIISHTILFVSFKVHVSESSKVPDHCRCFALSDAKCPEYQGECSHTHDGVCDRCSLVEVSIREVEDALKVIVADSDEMDELMFNTEQAKRSISAWKGHLLRAVNQDEARVNVMENWTKLQFS